MLRISKQALAATVLACVVGVILTLSVLKVTGVLGQVKDNQDRGLDATPHLVCIQQEFYVLFTPDTQKQRDNIAHLSPVKAEAYRKLQANLKAYYEIESQQPIEHLAC